MSLLSVHIFKNRRHGSLTLVLLLTLLATLTAYRFVRAKPERAITTAAETPTDTTSGLVQTISQPRLEAERVTLRATGFEPREITRPAGRFLLAVNDRSGQRDVVFVLMRESGRQLHRVRVRETTRKHEWRQVVNLAPGTYVLSEAAHPDWTCRITLTGN